jgi:hypothetical protein
VSAFSFEFNVPCVADADVRIGSDCSLETTADTLIPGAIRENARAIWQLGQVNVYDGGVDGDADTAADNTPFLTQGVFVP